MIQTINRFKERYQKINPSAKVSIWYIICNIIQNGISFITLPIFTRLLSVEQYGVVTVYNSWKGIISIFATLSLASGVFMTAYVKYEEDNKKLISSLQGLSFVITVVVFIVYCLCHDYFLGIIQLPSRIMFCMFVEILVQPGYAFWLTKLKYECKYIPMVVTSLLVSIANPVVGIMMVLHFEEKDKAKIVSAALVYVVVYGSITIYNYAKGKSFFHKRYWSYALTFGIPLVPHYLSLIVLGQADRIMIGNICGTREAALYGMGYNLATVLSIVYGGINQALGPSIMRALKSKKYEGIRKIITSVLLLMFGLMSLISLVYPELIHVLATDEYYDVVSIMPIITFSIMFTVINNCFAKVEMFYEKKYFIMISSLCAAVLNVVLNFIFIPNFGYKAAGYTTLVCYIVLSIMHYIVYINICKKEMNGFQLFDIKKMFLLGVGALLGALIVCFINQVTIVRFIIVLFIVILFWKKRNVVKEMLKSHD